MPTLSLTKSYATATVPYEIDLDNIKNGTELLVNTTKLDSTNIAAKGVTGTNLNSNSVTYAKLASTVTDLLVPVGTILPWYSFSGTLSFSTTYYAYCDGTSATLSTIGSQMLPDMSNRYLVGFGTEGGGDIGTATWSTTVPGNVSHTSSITHQHGPGSYKFQVWQMEASAGGSLWWSGYDSDGTVRKLAYVALEDTADTSSTAAFLTTATVTSTTAYYSYDGVGETGDPNTGSYDLQPRSVRVRYIMRIT